MHRLETRRHKGHLSAAHSCPPLPLAQTSLCYHAVPSPLEIVTLGGSRLLWQHWRKLLRCTNVAGGVVVEETEERDERVVKYEVTETDELKNLML